jgi:hypothetical protein
MSGLLYVFGLTAAFASAWFVLAALQTFVDAEPQRLTNVVIAVAFAALAALMFWVARRASREEKTSATSVTGTTQTR